VEETKKNQSPATNHR